MNLILALIRKTPQKKKGIIPNSSIKSVVLFVDASSSELPFWFSLSIIQKQTHSSASLKPACHSLLLLSCFIIVMSSSAPFRLPDMVSE